MEQEKPSEQKNDYTQDLTPHYSPFISYLNGIFFTLGALTVIIVLALCFFIITLIFFANIYTHLFA